jgi:hypothetical protein
MGRAGRAVRPVDLVDLPQYRLGPACAEDFAQSVWLHLVDHLGKIREPAALAGWLATHLAGVRAPRPRSTRTARGSTGAAGGRSRLGAAA